MTNQTAIEPVRKQIAVASDVETAFRTFTEDIAAWWPVAGHSKTGEGSVPVFEGRTGGRMYERARDGQEHDWATILVYEPPHRVVLEWTVNSAAPPTEVPTKIVRIIKNESVIKTRCRFLISSIPLSLSRRRIYFSGAVLIRFVSGINQIF